MNTIAYVVSFTHGNLSIAQVTVERETEKSHILQRLEYEHRPNYESIIRRVYSMRRNFPKGGAIYFSRKKAMEEGILLVDRQIQTDHMQLQSHEELRERLRKEIK